MNENLLNKEIPVLELLSAATAPSYAEAMIRTVNISDAKANLSKLADDVALGEEVIVARSGKPLMKLVALSEAEKNASEARKLPRDLWVRPSTLRVLTGKSGIDWMKKFKVSGASLDTWTSAGLRHQCIACDSNATQNTRFQNHQACCQHRNPLLLFDFSI
jgi:prevent-host-death family protein